ncbi:hypothetical protein [Stenotrophomonas sp. PS02297]|nr:hypothetical protein [Stenotrophomonas sp. PS02297]
MAAAGIAVIKTRLDQLLEVPSEVARFPTPQPERPRPSSGCEY